VDLSEQANNIGNLAMRQQHHSTNYYQLTSLALVIALLTSATGAQSASSPREGNDDAPVQLNELPVQPDPEWRALGRSERKEREEWLLTTDKTRVKFSRSMDWSALLLAAIATGTR